MSITLTAALRLLLDDIESASVAVREADEEERRARSKVADARNRLNAAQGAFDKAVAEMKGKAPSGSDWRRGPSSSASIWSGLQ